MGPCNTTSKKKTEEPVKKTNKNQLPKDEKALMDCKITRDNIKKEIKKLDEKKNVFKTKAKIELKSNNREKAKSYLSRSKLFEKQYDVYNGQLTMIEEQINSIQSMKMQQDAIKVLSQGNEVLKKLNEEVNVNKWEDLKDDMNSLKQQQDEIASVFKNYGIDEIQYNEELDKELQILIDAENKNVNFPEVTKKEIVKDKVDVKAVDSKQKQMVNA